MEHDPSKQSLAKKERVSTRTSHPSRPPLREINNPASTITKRSACSHVKPRKQHCSESVKFPEPTLNCEDERIQYRDHSALRPSSHKNLPPSTSHTRYSKPYSLSAFAPNSYLPNRKPPSSAPVSGDPQARESPSQSTIDQHPSRNSTRTRS